MLWASPFRLTRAQLKWAACLGQIRLQVKWASHKSRIACLKRGKTPKLKVLWPRINILSLKNLSLQVIVLSVARKATEPRTIGNKVNCSLCLHLQANTEQKKKIQFPNRETDFVKGCLWLLIWFWLGVRSWCQTICCYSCKAAAATQQTMLLRH